MRVRARVSPHSHHDVKPLFFFVLHHRGVGGGRSTCGAPFCPPLSVWLSRTHADTHARTHAAFGVVVERHNRSVVEAPLAWGWGVEASRCVDTFGSLFTVTVIFQKSGFFFQF